MPFWVSLLIQLALKYGLPWLESHVSPAIAALIEEILKHLKSLPPESQGKAVTELHEIVKKHCSGIGCAPDLVGQGR